MATTFKKTPVASYPKVGEEATPDSLYWKRLEFPVTRKEYGAVCHVEFSPVHPYNYIATSAAKIQLFSPLSHQVEKTFSRFRDNAFGGSFRGDGKLLVAGSEEKVVKLFDASTKAQLRVFKGHSSAVHSVKFTCDGHHVVSVSDDKSCRLWDISNEDQLLCLTEHQDYVRSVATSPNNQSVFLSGSYDHTAKLYDSRQGSSVMTVTHGVPVEDVLIFPGGGAFITAGGTSIKVWDALGGGRLLASFSNHHKTVTSLCFCTNNSRLASAGLDRHVNIYDVSTYQVVHTLDYPSPILSLDIARDDSAVAVGMADGLLSVQRRREDKTEKQKTKTKKKKASFVYELHSKTYTPSPDDHLVEHKRRQHLAKYDKFFRKFEYSKALDAALELKLRMRQPEVTYSVLQELIRRDGLRAAVAGRDSRSISQLLKFIQRNISNPRFSVTLVDVADLVLDLYAEHVGEWAELDDLLLRLRETVDTEVSYMTQLMQTIGAMTTMFTVAEAPARKTDNLSEEMTPSQSALDVS